MEKTKTANVSLESFSADNSLSPSILEEKTTHMHIAIKSPSAEDDNLRRLDHVFPAVSDRGLEEGFKRAFEKTCCEEMPVYKRQKKESWAFHEPDKVVKTLPSTMESSTSTSKAINSLAGLTGDNRRAKISQMLQEATVIARAVGELDPEHESHPDGRRRFQRRNSFVIHRNRNTGMRHSTGMFPAVAPSTTMIKHPFNGIRNEESAVLGIPPRESNMFFSTGMFPAVAPSTTMITQPNEEKAVRRRSLPWSQSLNESNHSERSSRCPNTI
jgi:hypothetical protein